MTKQPGPLTDVTRLPQQRLYAVPELPYHLFVTKVEIAQAGDPGIPNKIPRGARFILQVEWAWSPMNNYLANYHISLDTSRRRWVLWESFLSDEQLPFRWYSVPEVSLIDKKGVTREDAAVVLLKSWWERNRDRELLDHYHFINQTGLIGIGAVAEIGKFVWSDQVQWSPTPGGNKVPSRGP